MFQEQEGRRIRIETEEDRPPVADTEEAPVIEQAAEVAAPEPEPESASEEQSEHLTVAEELTQLQAQVEEEKDARLRALAELQNFRRRSHQERAEVLRYACEPVLTELIPVLDHFEMATDAAEENEQTRIFCEGYEMILQQLKEALTHHGLEEIEAVEGMFFDPEYHEVVERIQTKDPCEGTVMKVLRKGYKLHDRILRPVRVAVSVPPEE